MIKEILFYICGWGNVITFGFMFFLSLKSARENKRCLFYLYKSKEYCDEYYERLQNLPEKVKQILLEEEMKGLIND